MKRREPHERVRVTAAARPVVRSVTPAQIEAYLVGLGYRSARTREGTIYRKGEGRDAWAVPSPRDARYELSVIVEAIAAFERRSPASTLRAIATHAKR